MLHLLAAVGTLPEAPVLELEDLEACGLPVPVRHSGDSGQLLVYTALHSLHKAVTVAVLCTTTHLKLLLYSL